MTAPATPAETPVMMNRGWTSLTWAMFIFLALLPVGLLGIYSFEVTVQSVHELVLASNLSAATVAAELVGHQLDETRHVAAAIASLPGMVDAVRNRDEDGMRDRLKPVVDAFGSAIDRAYVLDTRGVLRSDYPQVPAVIGSAVPLYRELVSAGNPVVSDVFQTDDWPRRLAVASAAPIWDSHHDLVGVAACQVRLEGATAWLKRTNVNERIVFILDRRGTVAAHPSLDLQARRYKEYAGLDPVRRALDGEKVVDEYDDPMAGRRMVAAFLPVSVAGGRWVVVAQQPVSDAYAPLDRLRRQIGVGAGILGLAALGAALILGRTSGRVRRLSRALGERNARLDVERTQLRTLIDHLPDHIFIKDFAGRYIIDNAAHTRFLGQASPDHVVGKTVFDFFPKELAEKFTLDDRQVIASGKALVNREEPITDDSGQVRWVSTTKVPVRDASGKVAALVCISSDVTARVQAEKERAALLAGEQAARAQAEEAVQALKRAQSQMVQTEKLSSLGMLVAGVAHEINNPLAFVTNNLAVLQRDCGEMCRMLKLYGTADPVLTAHDPTTAETLREAAERMDLPYVIENVAELVTRSREGVRRIQQIVKDLREFSRQEVVGDMQDGADLNAGVESTLNIVHGRAVRSGVTLEPSLAKLPGITCHPAKINQVILNLVVNAIDASQRGGKVSVRTHAVPDGVQLQVEDTGSGIPPDIQARIFDPFFTTKPIGQGTGLGLSISHGIITDHGGHIEVASVPGQGSCFSVFLPLAPPTPRAAVKSPEGDAVRSS